jgi:hypothetical protein
MERFGGNVLLEVGEKTPRRELGQSLLYLTPPDFAQPNVFRQPLPVPVF